ncbi:MAG: CDP-alcohol phosphatidyltransferase family protein [Elusimicrobia bacterium]|nr:CDP-alcohol phosphatidyltransferase family protein [Elusimicrobiota bacterium]
MITTAGLWVSHPKLLFARVGGATVLERQLNTLALAGITDCAIAARKPEPADLAGLRFPEGLSVRWIARKSDEVDSSSLQLTAPYVTVSGDHFVRVETLRHVITTPYATHVQFVDEIDLAVLQVIPFRTEDMVASSKVPLPAGSSVFLEASGLQEGLAMDWLLSLGFKSQDGFMARHFDRYISLSITRTLIETRVTPNAMTVVSCLIGLAGTALFIFTPAADILAAWLIWLHSVLDGCDGEMARIRFQESDFGGDIDFWGDNVVHLSLFACLAAGMARAGNGPAPILGLAATAGIVGSATLAYWRRVATRKKGPGHDRPAEASLLARLETFLEQRDFIYLLLAMTFFNLTYYFLWAGAVGAPLFFVLMLGAGKAPIGTPAAAKAPGEA